MQHSSELKQFEICSNCIMLAEQNKPIILFDFFIINTAWLLHAFKLFSVDFKGRIFNILYIFMSINKLFKP